jgi:hypothetical protein
MQKQHYNKPHTELSKETLPAKETENIQEKTWATHPRL